MNLLKTVNNAANRVMEAEVGASVGASSIATTSTPLFASMVKRSPLDTSSTPKKQTKKHKKLGLQEAFDDMVNQAPIDPASSTPRATSSPSFDSSAVISKLKSLENKEKQDIRDTVSFGLEDDNGGLVRVTVRAEQSQDFERALQSFVSDEEELEIAEILFKLRDQFDIVDVQWPNVEEDEEEDVTIAQDAPMPNTNDDDLLGDETGAPLQPAAQDVSVLTQVIDMMKADAEARKAEANARAAEAKTKEAESVINQAMAKVKQEEQFLDMETYNKAKKDEEREAKRLAQLAKWKHDMEAKDQGVSDEPVRPSPQATQFPEEEEYSTNASAPVRTVKSPPAPRVRPHEIADFILNRVKK